MVINLEALNVKFDTFVENSKIDTLSNDVSPLKKTVSMLCARLESSDTIVAGLSRELTEMKTHSMKYNLIFNFDKTSRAKASWNRTTNFGQIPQCEWTSNST